MTEKADKPKHNSQSASKTHLTTPEQIAPETIPDTASPDLLRSPIGAFSASPPNISTILRLQSTIGNQAVQRLLNNNGQMTSPYATAINPKSRVTISRDYRDRLQRDDAPPSASDDFMGEGWTDVNKLGLVHQDDGANLRDKPQPGGESTVLQNLPQNTKVMILKHNTTTQWRAIRRPRVLTVSRG